MKILKHYNLELNNKVYTKLYTYISKIVFFFINITISSSLIYTLFVIYSLLLSTYHICIV